MLTRTELHFDIAPIIAQVNALNLSERSIVLNETTGSLLNGPYTIKQEFIGTPLGDVLATLGEIGEARLLRLDSGQTYTAHTDPDDRLHLSIISNPYCYLVNLEDNTLHNLPVDGYIWDMDTSIMHSAINLGGRERIHLNVRAVLPKFKRPGKRLTFLGGDFDWKQELYKDLMGYVNKNIKDGLITGFEKVNDREVLISYTDRKVLNYITAIAVKKGFTVQATLVE